MSTEAKPDYQRLAEEATFFDRWAEKAAEKVLPLDAAAVERYSRRPLRKRFNKEFRFGLLGDLRGRDLLEVGCGEGGNSALLAKFGANVTGIDVSEKAIALAQKKAEINGVAHCTRFLCAPLETVQFAPDSFDVIYGEWILHHVIPDLELILARLVKWARPQALIVFAEPINLNQTLRRIRFLLPVHTETTPGERPLEEAELRLIRHHIPDLSLRHFSLFGRLDRFILTNKNFERSSRPRRYASSGIAFLDYGLLSLPWMRNLAANAILWGHSQGGSGSMSRDSK
jgi:2-polyprenyl-3-methyl-5-hydroxy-6-metoxy-1,4-benzoquinol methylase